MTRKSWTKSMILMLQLKTFSRITKLPEITGKKLTSLMMKSTKLKMKYMKILRIMLMYTINGRLNSMRTYSRHFLYLDGFLMPYSLDSHGLS